MPVKGYEMTCSGNFAKYFPSAAPKLLLHYLGLLPPKVNNKAAGTPPFAELRKMGFAETKNAIAPKLQIWVKNKNEGYFPRFV